eukprot:5090411-Pleurochrysis_carterae.AAC.2
MSKRSMRILSRSSDAHGSRGTLQSNCMHGASILHDWGQGSEHARGGDPPDGHGRDKRDGAETWLMQNIHTHLPHCHWARDMHSVRTRARCRRQRASKRAACSPHPPPPKPFSSTARRRTAGRPDGRTVRADTGREADGGRRDAPRRCVGGSIGSTHPTVLEAREGVPRRRTHPKPRKTDGWAWTPVAPRLRYPPQFHERGASSQSRQLTRSRPIQPARITTHEWKYNIVVQ